MDDAVFTQADVRRDFTDLEDNDGTTRDITIREMLVLEETSSQPFYLYKDKRVRCHFVLY